MPLQYLRIDSTSATNAEKSVLDLPTHNIWASLNTVVEMQDGSNGTLYNIRILPGRKKLEPERIGKERRRFKIVAHSDFLNATIRLAD